MISLTKRLDAFISLGKILRDASNNKLDNKYSKLETSIQEAALFNGWFTEPNVRLMLGAIGESLKSENVMKWIESYRTNLNESNTSYTIGVVMAGNIPLVGFHDFMCVLISGNRILAKLSSDDNKLLPILSDILIEIEPGFQKLISFTPNKLVDIDAIIATGSNNSSRYFEHYFGKYPNIIRSNRNGIAVLSGNENESDLQAICNDIFSYFGLGCRNVSHLFVPEDYDFSNFLRICQSHKHISEHSKYFNNYEYNKAIYLVNSTPHFDSGNLLLVEDENFSTPVSVVSYEKYTNQNDVGNRLLINEKSIQCIISKEKWVQNSIVPGTSQKPQLWDYADNIDTMDFLINL